MKKTLIALAVSASAVVSCSAMAWTENGTGGSVELSGTLTPVEKVTPWETEIGAAVDNLDANVQKGQRIVVVSVDKAIPVLGIRTHTKKTFPGQHGISPQIDFHDAIDINTITDSEAKLILDVKGCNGDKIGTLSTSLLVGAEYSYTGPYNEKAVMVASRSGDGFFGGLPKDKSGSLSNPHSRVAAISSSFDEKYNDQGTGWAAKGGGFEADDFTDSAYQFSAFYGSGIEQGKTITITLDKAASGDAPIQWKASLPVTVTYI